VSFRIHSHAKGAGNMAVSRTLSAGLGPVLVRDSVEVEA